MAQQQGELIKEHCKLFYEERVRVQWQVALGINSLTLTPKFPLEYSKLMPFGNLKM